jgi:hypothetical protein
MSRPSKGIRLWLESEERDKGGKLIHRAAWVIRDGPRKIRTGCARENREGAERRSPTTLPPNADLWQTAGLLGMTVEMLQQRYGHHHPEFQREAAEAISRPPGQKRDRNPVNKTRQTSSNVTKTIVNSGGGR